MKKVLYYQSIMRKKTDLPPLLVIVGPTASGKTALAVKLAKMFNGEIISADSRQVYKGLDIGSGKDKHLYTYTPIHLLDVISPQGVFTVSQYQRLATKAIKDIHNRGRLPILCGGSGLYINAITMGLKFPASKPDLKLRRALAKKSLPQLLTQLKRLDRKAYQKIDQHNRRRVERALEILLHTKKPLSESRAVTPPPYRILMIGIKVDRDELKKKIIKRLEQRLGEGLIQEVKRFKRILSNQRLNSLGLEYAWVNHFLNRQISKQELILGLSGAIANFAKRQMTWFKKDKRIKWVKNLSEAIMLVKKSII